MKKAVIFFLGFGVFGLTFAQSNPKLQKQFAKESKEKQVKLNNFIENNKACLLYTSRCV